MKYLTSILSALLLGTAPAWGAQPLIGGPFTLVEKTCPLFDCGDGLTICQEATIEFIAKIFLDDSGNFVRYWNKNNASGYLFEQGNEDNFVYFENQIFVKEYDFLEDVTTLRGKYARINIPGYGEILHDIGNIYVEGLGTFPDSVVIFEAGEHQVLGEEYQAVCDYLAGF